jgi:hypothetical protein
MKFKCINPSPYTFRGRDITYGEVIELPEGVGKRYAHLFAEIAGPAKVKPSVKRKYKIADELSVKQLKELAKKYNIKLENGLARKEIVDKLNFVLPNE